MKKLLIVFLLLAANAQAENYYTGIDFQSNSLGITTNTVNLSGGSIKPKDKDFYDLKSQNFPSIYVGYNIHQNLAAELSYSYINTSKTNTNTGLILVESGAPVSTTSKIRIHNLGFDIKPQVSVNDFKFFGIAGLNLLRGEVQESFFATGFSSDTKQSTTTIGYSLGAGTEYSFTKNLALRLQGKYTLANLSFNQLNGLKSIDSIMALSAGVKYSF